jgi:ABC-type branched-subunit amino acid transport system substrate-binding protein
MRSCLVIVVVALLAGCSRQAEPEPLWIGHLAPLSGPNRERGEDAVRAMKLRLEQVKADGKTFGGREVAVRHVDAVDKATARAEAVRLLAVNRVLGLLVGPALEDADDVVTTARAHSAPVVALEPDPEAEGAALARFVLTKLKRTEAVVSREADDRAVRRLADAFETAWREGGGSLVADTRPGVAMLRARQPASVEVSGDSYSVSVYPAGLAVPEAAREWAAGFQKRFSRPPTADALMAHDALGILLAGLEELTVPTRQTLLEAASKQKTYDGLTGTLRQADGRWRWPMFIVRHRAGKADVAEAVPVPER